MSPSYECVLAREQSRIKFSNVFGAPRLASRLHEEPPWSRPEVRLRRLLKLFGMLLHRCAVPGAGTGLGGHTRSGRHALKSGRL